MYNLLRKFTSIAVLLAFPLASHASLNWNWLFEQDNLGQVGPTDVIHGRATLFNEASSSTAIDMATMLYSYGRSAVYVNGANYADIVGGFGYNDQVSWANADTTFRSFTINPGESKTFDFLWFSPPYDAPIAIDGNYSVNARIEICETGSSCGQGSQIERNLQWTVSSVPEPQTFLLFATGGIALLGRRKMHLLKASSSVREVSCQSV